MSLSMADARTKALVLVFVLSSTCLGTTMPTSTQAKVNCVSSNDRYLVAGWTRNEQRKYKLTIPLSVQYICLMFYHVYHDLFDHSLIPSNGLGAVFMSNHTVVIDNTEGNFMIDEIKKIFVFKESSFFLKRIIEIPHKKIGIHSWIFQIKKGNLMFNALHGVGIADSQVLDTWGSIQIGLSEINGNCDYMWSVFDAVLINNKLNKVREHNYDKMKYGSISGDYINVLWDSNTQRLKFINLMTNKGVKVAPSKQRQGLYRMKLIINPGLNVKWEIKLIDYNVTF